MMRALLVLLALFFVSPALAQSWPYYDNSRFGYEVDIPPDFTGQGEADNGDGQAFAGPGSTQIVVWGGLLTAGDLEAELASNIVADEAQSWTLTNQTVTSRWANYSSIKGSRMAYQRMILLCDGQSYAALRADFLATELSTMTPIIERLTTSLQPVGC